MMQQQQQQQPMMMMQQQPMMMMMMQPAVPAPQPINVTVNTPVDVGAPKRAPGQDEAKAKREAEANKDELIILTGADLKGTLAEGHDGVYRHAPEVGLINGRKAYQHLGDREKWI